MIKIKLNNISVLVQNWTTPNGILKTYAVSIDNHYWKEFLSAQELNDEIMRLTN